MAAAAEFDELGYSGTSLSGIAARLGKTKGALSYHFASKADLAREVTESQYRLWADVLGRVRGDGYGGLTALVLLSFAVGRRFRDDVMVRAGIRLQQDTSLRGVPLPTPYVGWIRITSELLAEARSAGEVDGTVDADAAAEFLVEAFSGLQQVAHRLTAASDIEDRIGRYWAMLLPGLGASGYAPRILRLAAASSAY